MKYLKLSVYLLFCVNAQALDTDKAAHFGMSFAINTVSYGVFNKTLGIAVVPAILLSMSTTILIGVVKEQLDKSTTGFNGNDLLADSLGSAASSITILTFGF
jgi:hypothetical protein